MSDAEFAALRRPGDARDPAFRRAGAGGRGARRARDREDGGDPRRLPPLESIPVGFLHLEERALAVPRDRAPARSGSACSRSCVRERWPSVALLVVGLGIALAPLVHRDPGEGRRGGARHRRRPDRARAEHRADARVAATTLFDGMVSDVRTKLEPAFAASSVRARPPGAACSRRASRRWRSSPTTGRGRSSAQSHALSDSQVALGRRVRRTRTASRSSRSPGCSSSRARCWPCSAGPRWCRRSRRGAGPGRGAHSAPGDVTGDPARVGADASASPSRASTRRPLPRRTPTRRTSTPPNR